MSSGPYLYCTDKLVIDSPPGGNGNGRFDPGEDGQLLLSLRNFGNAGANNVQARLCSGHEYLAFTDPLAGYGSMPPGSTRVNTDDPFEVHVDPRMPIETPVVCSLFLTGDEDYCDTLKVTIIVGELRSIDPIPDGPRQPARCWAYDDADEGYGECPEFEWVEIGGVGTPLTLGDDQTVQVDLPYGFVWSYYGQQSAQISVCGNGWITPGYTTTSTYTNTGLPSTSMPACVAVCWDDLYPPTGGGVWYHHDADNHRFIIEWDSVHYYSPRENWDKFQLVIYDTTVHTPTGDNVILAQYLTANSYSSNTVGIQDPTLSIAIQYVYDGAYHRAASRLEIGRAIKYTTAEPTTGIAAERPEMLPTSGALAARVSPNPFSQTTLLAVTPAGPQVVDLQVFDNAGRLVRTLTRHQPLVAPTGFRWDGRDDQGRAVAAGIYFFRLGSELAESWSKVIVTR